MTESHRIGMKEAARVLDVSEQTLRAWSDKGIISATRHPHTGARSFDSGDIEAHARYRRTVSAGAEDKRMSVTLSPRVHDALTALAALHERSVEEELLWAAFAYTVRPHCWGSGGEMTRDEAQGVALQFMADDAAGDCVADRHRDSEDHWHVCASFGISGTFFSTVVEYEEWAADPSLT